MMSSSLSSSTSSSLSSSLSFRQQQHYLLVSFVLVVLLSMVCISDALLCYTCSYVASSGSMDDSCVYDPKNSINCTKKYCTIIRQDLVKPSGQIVSFTRNCENKPLYLNAIKTDTTYKMYFRSCISDLCNDSDGTHSATNSDPNFGAAENMIIKGRL